MPYAADLIETGPLHGRLSLTAYELPPGLSFEEWASEAPTLITMARASMFWIGDWIRYGEANYGERYAQAIEATGLTLQTLRNAVWVCDRIPPSERQPDVPFSHHRAVAALEPKDRKALLQRAADEGLAEHEVRAEVRRHRDPDPVDPDPPDLRSALLVTASETVALLHDAESAGDWSMVARARAMLEAAVEAEA
jgi:hypothetical protein